MFVQASRQLLNVSARRSRASTVLVQAARASYEVCLGARSQHHVDIDYS
jgi:hypothetical protein